MAIVEHLHRVTLPSASLQTARWVLSTGAPLPRTNRALADDGQNLVARVDQLLDFEVDLAEDGEELAPALPHSPRVLGRPASNPIARTRRFETSRTMSSA